MFKTISVPSAPGVALTNDFISTRLSSLNMKKIILVTISVPVNEKVNVKVFGDKKYFSSFMIENENEITPLLFDFVLNDYQQNYFIEVLSDNWKVLDTFFHFKDKNQDCMTFTVKKKVDDDLQSDEGSSYESNGEEESEDEEEVLSKVKKVEKVNKEKKVETSDIKNYFSLIPKEVKYNEDEEIHYIQASGKPMIREKKDDEKQTAVNWHDEVKEDENDVDVDKV